MIYYALVAADGRIVQTGRTAPDDLDLQGWPGVQAVACPEHVDDVSHWFVGGEFIVMPPRPGEWATFDPSSGAWVDARSPDRIAADLAAAKAQAIAAVNDWAGRARARHITIAPGQSMIYLAKEAEARAWIADPTPDPAAYPLLSAELGITAPDAWQLAQIWLGMADIWRQAAAQLEALRLGTIAQIEAAQDEAAVSEITIPT